MMNKSAVLQLQFLFKRFRPGPLSVLQLNGWSLSEFSNTSVADPGEGSASPLHPPPTDYRAPLLLKDLDDPPPPLPQGLDLALNIYT